MASPSAATYTEEEMLAVGGTLWAKRGYRRVYFPDWTTLVIGLKIELFSIGAVQSAAFQGKELAPRRAGVLLSDRVYWEDGRLHYDDVASHSKQYFGDDRLVRALLDGIAQAVKEKGKTGWE